MKKLFFTLALAFSGLFANASNEVPAKKSIELQSNMVISNEKLSAEENDNYFYSRPVESQIGALASPQSQVIESREWLDEAW